MRKKTIAFVILMVLLASTFFAASAQPATFIGEAPAGFCGFIASLGGSVVVLADPVPGGGPGGDN